MKALVLGLAVLGCLAASTTAQTPPRFNPLSLATNADVTVKVVAPKGAFYQVDKSGDLQNWDGLLTGQSAGTGTNTHTDTSALGEKSRYYRTAVLVGTNHLSGDHLTTTNGDLVFHPVNHASLVMTWNGLTIYNDPVGGAALYKLFPKADLIIVTHSHGDHFDSATLTGISTTNTVLLTPADVYASLSAALKKQTISLQNGKSSTNLNIITEAIPAYNGNHTKGTGNGYVLNLGGRRVFFTGDTGDIPEMRALKDIDVAFVCMNTPYTMTITEAANAVRAFKPKVVYPYHYRNSDNTLSDLKAFRKLVGADLGIEVRQRTWY